MLPDDWLEGSGCSAVIYTTVMLGLRSQMLYRDFCRIQIFGVLSVTFYIVIPEDDRSNFS